MMKRRIVVVSADTLIKALKIGAEIAIKIYEINKRRKR